MRVGVYVDGFNLYFGARDHCGQGTVGWRWLDIRGLVADALPSVWTSLDASIERVVYCTARVSGIDDPTTPRDQNVYLRALLASGSADHIEYGNFVRRIRTSPLATRTEHGKVQLVRSQWPVMIQDDSGEDVCEARFLVSHLHREEKGSDVNVATHLLLDVLGGTVDAAVVVSNDSDLELPLRIARETVPVGLLNPGVKPLAGKLKGGETDGVGNHWWEKLDPAAYTAHQLPDPVGKLGKPYDW
ncbi:MAG: NYN domain-containing protein [Solirubrobacteraceae bacterium]